MEATVPGGGVAVPVASPGRAANTRGVPGAALEGPPDPADPALEPDRGPSLLSQPGVGEMRTLYPDAARRAGIEGDVRLEIVVSESGEVLEVKVVRAAGNGFDEVAERLVRRFRFRPATSGGRPVPARIPWTYKFRLEG
jgi:protein TonB